MFSASAVHNKLEIPKCKFSKQMIKKYLATEYLFITEGEFLF
jgi:hypothetical protein